MTLQKLSNEEAMSIVCEKLREHDRRETTFAECAGCELCDEITGIARLYYGREPTDGFTDYLEGQRKRRNMTVEQFCKLLNISVKTYEDWQNNEQYPAMNILRMLEAKLSLEIYYLDRFF